jgi:hypothetical protein
MASHPANTVASSQAGIHMAPHRATTLFLKIIRAYHIRQCIFLHLTATEAAKLIHSTNIGNLIGQQERSRVLNPMRNLFTDDELTEIDLQLASDPDRHVLVVGRDLENLYARVENADKLDSGIPLLLSIVEATTCRVYYSNTSAMAELDGLRPGSEWRVVSTTNLPGEWSTHHPEAHTGFFKQFCEVSEVSEEKRDIRDKRIRLRRRKLEQVVDQTVGGKRRIIFDHLTHKGIMTLLKGNVKQCLGRATREPCVSGLDKDGFPMPVLDDLVFVDMRNTVMQKAINSGRTRNECVSSRQVQQAHIEVELATYARHVWYIPLGSAEHQGRKRMKHGR